jgi:hypothetical protein
MRLVIAAVALAALPLRPFALERSQAATPAPQDDAGPAAPPKAETAPKAAAPAKPPSPAARDLARALLTQEQWNKVLDSYASSLAGQISQALLSSGEKVPDDLKGKLRSELNKTLPYQTTIDAQAQALARELTPDELKRTAQFYSSPLGRKVLEKLPEAQSSVAQELQGRLATAVPEIVNRIAPKAMAGSPRGGGTGSGGAGGGSHPPGAGTTQ